jgi:hypothetical protein
MRHLETRPAPSFLGAAPQCTAHLLGFDLRHTGFDWWHITSLCVIVSVERRTS